MLWQPTKEFTESSNMFDYARFLKREKGLELNNYQELWQWSVNHISEFWESIWQYYQVMHNGAYQYPLQKSAEMMDAKWFEGTQLNYAEHIFRNKTNQYPAVVFQSETQAATEISWQELENKVASLAVYFKSLGVVKGDRVAAYLPNIPEALIAFLATNAIGAVWSSCSPDFGTASVIDRLSQIESKILIACDAYSYNGKQFQKRETVSELSEHLKSLKKLLIVGNPEWTGIMNTTATLEFTRVDFSDPIWILYSSGTTGKPKAITQSVGGMLIEHLKALGLHQNCKKGDKFFWYSTTGWMMWNYANAALLHGTTVVIYDGAPAYPNINVLWDLAEKTKITHFGAGASFYISCMKEGVN